MRPPVTQAASIASRIARAARAAEKKSDKTKQGEIAVALKQLKKAKKTTGTTKPTNPIKPTDLNDAKDTPTQPQDNDTPAAGHPKAGGRPTGTTTVKDISETTRYQALSSYRNSYTFYPHNDYPLGETISKVLASTKGAGPSGKDKFPDNVEVVSPALCDDIINYIGPDLDKHKGCDIIDLHPGACVWSQKIHDYLKPRRHLLLEPDERYLDPFIKPLLDQKDSAYRHSFLSGAHPKSYWGTYDRIFDDHLLPKRVPLGKNDPRLREPNNSLLVIGSLVRRYPERNKANNVHFPSLVLHHMAEAAQVNSMFQRYGLVRMLLWVPEEIIPSVLPNSMLFKLGYSVSLEAALDITQVVGGDRWNLTRSEATKAQKHQQRRDQLDTWSSRRVLASMQEKGMTLPEHRRPEMHQRALVTDDKALQDYNPIRLPEGMNFSQSLAHIEKEIKQLEEFPTLPKVSRYRFAEQPHRYKFTNISEEITNPTELNRCGRFVDIWGVQIALELEYNATKSTMSEELRLDAHSRLVATSIKLKELFELLFQKRTRKSMTVLLDELFALCKKNTMLAWDRRPYEPLIVAEEEFWPRFPMQLLDITPRPEALGNDLMDTAEANQVRRGLIKALFTHPSSPLLESIERLGAGAREGLVVPEFTDPLAGGRIDPSQLLTKDITREQLNALTKAYIEWPFRPIGAEAIEAQAMLQESVEV